MPTKIRLQQHGVRNHPYWWIIVQGPNRNAAGRLIEHMGFWIPRQCVTVDRAIVLNRPRLKYWLGMGAEPSLGVWKILQYAGFMPRRPPAHGSDCLYQKPEKVFSVKHEDLTKRLGAFKDRVEEVRRVEAHIQETRRLYEANAKDWASYSRKPTAGEMTVDKLEKTMNKREIENVFDQYAMLMGAFDRIAPNAPNEVRYLALTGLVTDETNLFDAASAPVLAQELNITLEKAEEIIQVYESVKQNVLMSDVADMKEDLKFTGKKTLTTGRVYIPSPHTITPLPNFEADELNEVPQQLLNFRNSLRYEEPLRRATAPVKKPFEQRKKKLRPNQRWDK